MSRLIRDERAGSLSIYSIRSLRDRIGDLLGSLFGWLEPHIGMGAEEMGIVKELGHTEQ